MANTRLDEADGLTAADVIHSRISALPASATIGEVRTWFAGSSSRRLALLADDGRYVGRLVPDDLDGTADPAGAAAELARPGETVAPDAPASRAQELALQSAELRVPVVDREGRLLGVVAVTADREAFCGTGETASC